jgi:dCMP deaminase
MEIQQADKWDILWIDSAERFSRESKDRSTKVGCVIVTPDRKTFITSGWNGFTRGVNDNIDSRHCRPEKYKWSIHAECNAIYNHARKGGPGLDGSIAYMNYIPFPCSNCLSALNQSGIKTIVGPPVEFPGVGKGEFYDIEDITSQIFDETEIEYLIVDYTPGAK